MYLGGCAGFVTEGRVVSSQRVGEGRGWGRSEGVLWSMNQTEVWGVLPEDVCNIPKGDRELYRERGAGKRAENDRENGRRREFLHIFQLSSF